MKNLRNISLLALMVFFTSCMTTIKFPTSDVTPAADISASKKSADKNGNYKISITAKNLASADRLDPSQSVYVAWIVTNTEGTKSIGRLTNKNAKTANLETLTPFAFNEIFITAEGLSDVSYPYGIEITRANFRK
ncbi:MAG: hypothetical protein P1P82_00760 [Bacteroidales bacterium]|nr:hypothetical protein [Bacteroidales bacterium]MDT8430086.1 hypothetical protein [Bacteroidales bacterium]